MTRLITLRDVSTACPSTHNNFVDSSFVVTMIYFRERDMISDDHRVSVHSQSFSLCWHHRIATLDGCIAQLETSLDLLSDVNAPCSSLKSVSTSSKSAH
jgi:hypothetical protein